MHAIINSLFILFIIVLLVFLKALYVLKLKISLLEKFYKVAHNSVNAKEVIDTAKIIYDINLLNCRKTKKIANEFFNKYKTIESCAEKFSTILKIEFVNVNTDSLKNINLTLLKKDIIAIKCTKSEDAAGFKNILLKLNKTYSGQVYLDGLNLVQITNESLYKKVCLTDSDSVMFEGLTDDVNINFYQDYSFKLSQVKSEMEEFNKLTDNKDLQISLARAIFNSDADVYLFDFFNLVSNSNSVRLIKKLNFLLADKIIIYILNNNFSSKECAKEIYLTNGELEFNLTLKKK